MMYRNIIVLFTLAITAACMGPAGQDGPAGPQGPQGEQGEPGADGIDGVDGTGVENPDAAIAAVYPLALVQGRTGHFRVLGYFTDFSDSTTVDLGEGIEVLEVQVQSASSLHVKVNVSADAALGLRTLTVGDLTFGDPEKGTGLMIGPTLQFSPNEFVAGESFEAELHTSEVIASGTFDLENCVGLSLTSVTRITAKRWAVEGTVDLAGALGECSIRLIQNQDTDDEVVSVGNVVITEPNTSAFNGEGLATGTLNQEAPTQYILLTAEADQVVALRHQVDAEAGRDGTGPALAVYESGNLEPLFVHDGSDRWVEFYNDTERTLLIAVDGQDVPEEGIDYVVQSEVVTVPDLAAGVPTTGRVPLATGRAAWFRHHLQNASFLQVTVLPEEAQDLQPRTWIKSGDSTLHDAVGHFDGLANAGSVIFRVTDDVNAEADAMLQFTINVAVTELIEVGEDGTATGTVSPDANSQPFLVTVPAGQVLSASAAADGTEFSVQASWLTSPDQILSEGALVQVPTAEEATMVLTVSAADLAAEVEFTLTTSLIEPTALGVDGATGSAPEVGHAWFTADLADNFLGSVVVTPEVPEALQVELGVYGAEGQLLGGGTGTDVFAFVPAGIVFMSVSDAEFVAEENQAFTLSLGDPLYPDLTDEELAALPPAERRCHEGVVLNVGADGERGVFQVDVSVEGTNAVGAIGLDWLGNPAVNGGGPEQVLILNLTRPALLDAYLEATHDTVLYIADSCGTDSLTPLSGGLNDDGDDWNGNGLGVRSGINGVEIAEPGVYYLYIDGYDASDSGDVTLNLRLQDLN
jgi:hypothetical protein